MTETTTVDVDAGGYTQLTTASTGYALIGNPKGSGITVGIFIGATIPASDNQAKFSLNPDEIFQRTSEITDHIWGKIIEGGPDIKVSVAQ